MRGMVTAIKTTSKGKQKVVHSLYYIDFLDNEKLRCGLETVKEMQDSYVSCRMQCGTAMRNSSGEHVPFSGIKRKVPEKSTSSTLQAKKNKTRRTKTRIGYDGDGELQNQDGEDVAGSLESASGTLISLWTA